MLLDVDGPYRNRPEAESAAHKRRILADVRATVFSRINPRTSVIIKHTRYAVDDLIGTLAKEHGDTFEQYVVPAVNDDGEPAVTMGGRDRAFWDAQRKLLGEHDWWSLMQGRPRPRDGSLFRGVTTYSVKPSSGTISVAEIFSALAGISGVLFVITSMLAMGMSLTMAQILQPLKNTRLVTLALLSNFVLVPLVSYVIKLVIPLEQSLEIGLIVLATVAGAPFLPKLVQGAKGDVAFGVGLMVLLMVATIVYVPIVLPLLLTGVEVNPWDDCPVADRAHAHPPGNRFSDKISFT